MNFLLRWLRRGYALFMAYQAYTMLRNALPSVVPNLKPHVRGGRLDHETAVSPLDATLSKWASQAPLVSVIVPARDEASNIEACIHSLLAQQASDLPIEIIAVDDASTDQTGQLLDTLERSAPALHVLHLTAKPEGWAGKPYAMHQASQQAQGRWLLFTDADTRWELGAVETLVRYAEAHAVDLLSTLPRQVLPSLIERLVAPALLVTLFITAPPADVNSPHKKAAIANGQCLLLRRSVYQEIGGYARPDLRAALLDDTTLARIVKRAGYRLQMAGGQSLLTVRMYPSGPQAWQGWLRNLGTSFRQQPTWLGTLLLGFLVVLLVAPYSLTIAGLLEWRRRGRPTESTWIGMFSLGVTLTAFAWSVQALCLPLRYVLLHPVSSGLQIVLMAQAWMRHLRHVPLVWKGRAYPASPSTAPQSRSWFATTSSATPSIPTPPTHTR